MLTNNTSKQSAVKPLGPITTDKIIQALPSAVVQAFEKTGLSFYLGGGFIRAIVAGESPSDIDLFVPDQYTADTLADFFANSATPLKPVVHRSANAITIRDAGRPVQIITRWTYSNPEDVIRSFDFTLSQAVLWRDTFNGWRTLASLDFEDDVINRRLRYTSPLREEEKAGSLIRLFKFYKRGYTPELGTVAAVCARAFATDSYALDYGNILSNASRRIPKAPYPGDHKVEEDDVLVAAEDGPY